jgi:hypothetical protein
MTQFDNEAETTSKLMAGAPSTASAGSFELGSDLASMELPSAPSITSDPEGRVHRHPLSTILAAVVVGILIGKAWH